jgi:hypothetical protein
VTTASHSVAEYIRAYLQLAVVINTDMTILPPTHCNGLSDNAKLPSAHIACCHGNSRTVTAQRNLPDSLYLLLTAHGIMHGAANLHAAACINYTPRTCSPSIHLLPSFTVGDTQQPMADNSRFRNAAAALRDGWGQLRHGLEMPASPQCLL